MYASIQQVRIFVIIDRKLSFFCIFLRKYLVMSKKCCNFAVAFEKVVV